MTVFNASRLLITSGPHSGSLRRRASWPRDRSLGTVQVVLSAALLAGILLMYLVRPDIGIGASGVTAAPSVIAEPTWESLLGDARRIKLVVVTAGHDRIPESVAAQWALPIKQLSAEVGALVASGSALGADDATLRVLGEHSGALARVELPGASVEVVGAALDGLILELDELATVESVVVRAQLESANRAAVRAVGTRALFIAATAVVAAFGVIGLGTGVEKLQTSGVQRMRVRSASRPLSGRSEP